VELRDQAGWPSGAEDLARRDSVTVTFVGIILLAINAALMLAVIAMMHRLEERMRRWEQKRPARRRQAPRG
jgi:hypothetical protein